MNQISDGFSGTKRRYWEAEWGGAGRYQLCDKIESVRCLPSRFWGKARENKC